MHASPPAGHELVDGVGGHAGGAADVDDLELAGGDELVGGGASDVEDAGGLDDGEEERLVLVAVVGDGWLRS